MKESCGNREEVGLIDDDVYDEANMKPEHNKKIKRYYSFFYVRKLVIMEPKLFLYIIAK